MPDNDDLNKALTESMTKMNETLASLPETIAKTVAISVGEAMKQAAPPPVDKDDKPADPPPPSEEDIDTMSNSQLMTHISTTIGSLIEKQLGEVNKQIDDTRTSVNERAIAEEFEKVRNTDPELFDHLKEDMGALFKANQHLSPSHLFKLAQMENPEKVEKWKEENKKNDEPGEREKPQSLFGGQTPTSNSSNEGGDPPAKMSGTEAAEKAFDQVSADLAPFLSTG